MVNESQPLSRDSTAGASVRSEVSTTPTHYAILALLWLVLPMVGAPLAIVTGAIALLSRNGKNKLSTGMASVAVGLGIVEAVFIWLTFS